MLHSAGTKAYKARCNEAQSHSKPAQNCSVQKQMGSELLSFEAKEKDLCQNLKWCNLFLPFFPEISPAHCSAGVKLCKDPFDCLPSITHCLLLNDPQREAQPNHRYSKSCLYSSAEKVLDVSIGYHFTDIYRYLNQQIPSEICNAIHGNT